MNCALIGTSKISEVHLFELARIGVKDFTIITRNTNKGIKLCNYYKVKYPRLKFLCSNKKILKQKKFDIIDVCTSNNSHDIYLNYISKSNSIILVEKPIISLIKFKNNYQKTLNQIYTISNKIVVCYPMIYLAKSFKKYFNIKKKINTFDFIFQTGGRYKTKSINIDLMPHALSFISSFFSKNIFYKKKISIINVEVGKNKWLSQFTLGKIKFTINLNEKIGQKTKLEVKCNENKIVRITKKYKGNFTNTLKYKNKTKIINNPMTEFFNDFKKNKNKRIFFENNKKITYQIMKLNLKFLNGY